MTASSPSLPGAGQSITPAQFVAKWSRAELSERAASQEHFIESERPTWLKLAHEKLDRAVLSAYAATDPSGGGNWNESWSEVWRDTGAGQPLPNADPLTAKRAEVDQLVLANLLRLN